MNLVNNMRWAVIATSILSGSVLAADVNCTVTPVNSIITEGQSLQLQAACDGALETIDWIMDNTSVTGGVTLAGHVANQPLYYTTPVGLGGDNSFAFTVTGTPKVGTSVGSTTATVFVKPSSAVVAKAADATNATPTTPVAAVCGTANGSTVQAMPTNGEKCDHAKGTPALWISGPTSFTWACISLNGGAEANCSALRGYMVNTTSGSNGTVSASQGVVAGGTTVVTATPLNNYSASFASGTTCPGTASGNKFTAGPINATCTVNATFTNAPVDGQCGPANNSTPVASAPSGNANLCNSGIPTTVSGTAVPNKYSWGCGGTNGGVPTSATACQATKGYTVTATDNGAANGDVTAPPGLVASGSPATISITTAAGYEPTMGGDCPTGSLTGSGTSWTYSTGAITGACQVTASFALPQAGISCNGVTMPGTVTEIPTVLPAGTYPRTTFSSAPVDTVYSFKVTVPTGTAKDFFAAKAIKTTSAPGTRYMVISSCKGDYDIANKTAGCYRTPSEVATATATVNYTTTEAPETKYCHLQPGQTYWVNLSTRNSPTGTPMCNSALECGFYFEAN